jgi:hypothetical protein
MEYWVLAFKNVYNDTDPGSLQCAGSKNQLARLKSLLHPPTPAYSVTNGEVLNVSLPQFLHP